jgi:MFS family permease
MATQSVTARAPRAELNQRRWWTLSVLCLSLLMVIVGNTVLNIAIPTLIRALHASDRALQWMVDAYGLVFAGLLFTAGALGDRFGRKGALSLGSVVFGLGSAFAGVGHGSGQIVAGRAIMGVGAAFVMPSTLSGAGFTGGSIAISMMFFGMFGMFFLLTQYLQLVKGTGGMAMALIVGAAVAFVAAVLVGVILPQHFASSEQQARHGGDEVDSRGPTAATATRGASASPPHQGSVC